MSGRNEMRTRTFRWRSIRVSESDTDNTAVVEMVAKWLGDKHLSFCVVHHMGPQAVQIDYSPAFNDESRKIIFQAIKDKWPKSKICFYGEEAVTILRSAVCLDQYIQGI